MFAMLAPLARQPAGLRRSGSNDKLDSEREWNRADYRTFIAEGERKGSILKSMWPSTLWIVRHGESAGNVARDKALLSGLPDIAINLRDADVPLSHLGKQQSNSLGRWFSELKSDEQPEAILVSPYIRAQQTAEAIRQTSGLSRSVHDLVSDERLREKEFGILDRLTRVGIEKNHPELAEARALVGKFYFRPPGGESWCDVILRLRSVLDTLSIHYAGKRVLIVAHQVIVLCMRYLLEKMDEHTILSIDAEGDVANCSVTEYRAPRNAEGSSMILVRYNFTAPLEEKGTVVTKEPDASVGAR
jgi:probable phosphoglycerate mutase